MTRPITQTETPPPTEVVVAEVMAPSRPRSRVVVFPLVAAFLLFFTPAVAFIAGDRAEEVENRPLAEFPSLSEGWGFLPALQAWAIDHLPLRAQAIAANTAISEFVFGEAPKIAPRADSIGVSGLGGAPDADADAGDGIVYPQVIEGSDGWLFFGSDVEAPCRPQLPMSDIRAAFERLTAAANETGRRVVFVIAPDKSSAHPEFLPETYAGKECALEQKAAFWDAVDGTAAVIDPLPALSDYESTTGRPVWRKLDTHWAPEGAAVFSSLVASSLDPAIASGIVAGDPIEESGDLAAMMGTPATEEVVSAELDRPGVTLRQDGSVVGADGVATIGFTPLNVTASSTDAPLYPGRTLLFGDSFFDASRQEFPRLFEDLTYVHNMSADAPGGIDAAAAALADSDTLVIEMVERAAVGGYVSFQKPDNVDALVEAMRANPR